MQTGMYLNLRYVGRNGWHLQVIMWKVRFSERAFCFPILNNVCSWKVTPRILDRCVCPKDSALQQSAGLEPSKIRPQSLLFVQLTKLCFLSMKWVGFQGIPASILSGMKVAQSSFYPENTYHTLKAKWQASFSMARIVYKQAEYAQQDRKW